MPHIKKLVLGAVFAGLLMTPLAIAQPAMSATHATAPDCPRTITDAVGGETITMVAGTCATLSLRPGLVWTTPVSSSSAVGVSDTETVAPDAKWTLTAARPGKATITASGRPKCDPGMVCPLYIVEYVLHIRVVPWYRALSA